jgi:choline dehydrogenase-like flavoprotein
MAAFDYDVVIIGSGFGGSVAALRAAEKGYRVGVMEAGRRWRDQDIPKTNWDFKHYVWFPAAELYGIQRIEYLDDVLVLCGAGVGGGSHVYGNTLYVPPKQFFNAPGWAAITDWADELAPCYDQARADARRRPLPVHADRCRSVHPPSRDRHGERGNVQQGAGRCLLRRPRCRGRQSVLRRRWSAAHRMHLMRRLPSRSTAVASRCMRGTPVGGSERRICTATPAPPRR